ncbi:uncharacterized protein LOC134252622, partial [Saccostrea cucullata]|uniref:uncharacterized protein LOC134252622 n=1 Tax=Saccostrea cuccullata TaxID=36930 RepID=UPI002ED5F705
MIRQDTNTAKVGRYNSEGRELQHDSGQGLYVNPMYITEHLNGNVTVSDLIDNVSEIVVVTDSVGIHCFSNTGNSKESQFKRRGICTDALSRILLCDTYTKTVQMIDKDGQFLAVLLTEQQGIEYPLSLSYDHKSHLLWVGSLRNSTICIYKHLMMHEYLT